MAENLNLAVAVENLQLRQVLQKSDLIQDDKLMRCQVQLDETGAVCDCANGDGTCPTVQKSYGGAIGVQLRIHDYAVMTFLVFHVVSHKDLVWVKNPRERKCISESEWESKVFAVSRNLTEVVLTENLVSDCFGIGEWKALAKAARSTR